MCPRVWTGRRLQAVSLHVGHPGLITHLHLTASPGSSPPFDRHAQDDSRTPEVCELMPQRLGTAGVRPAPPHPRPRPAGGGGRGGRDSGEEGAAKKSGEGQLSGQALRRVPCGCGLASRPDSDAGGPGRRADRGVAPPSQPLFRGLRPALLPTLWHSGLARPPTPHPAPPPTKSKQK